MNIFAADPVTVFIRIWPLALYDDDMYILSDRTSGAMLSKGFILALSDFTPFSGRKIEHSKRAKRGGLFNQ